jgi:hypothetical protein
VSSCSRSEYRCPITWCREHGECWYDQVDEQATRTLLETPGGPGEEVAPPPET